MSGGVLKSWILSGNFGVNLECSEIKGSLSEHLCISLLVMNGSLLSVLSESWSSVEESVSGGWWMSAIVWICSMSILSGGESIFEFAEDSVAGSQWGVGADGFLCCLGGWLVLDLA